MRIEVKIPVKRYLKLFVHQIENIPPDGSLTLNGKGLVSLFLAHFISTKRYLADRPEKELSADFDDYITVVLSNAMVMKRWRIAFRNVHIVIFNNFLHKMFIYNLYLFATQAHIHRMEEREAILLFLETHGISEDDYAFETAKKAVFRRKKQIFTAE